MSTRICGRNLLKQIENKCFTYYSTEKVKNGDGNTNENDKNQINTTLL